MTRYLLIVPALALLGAAPGTQDNGSRIKPTRIVSPVPSTCDKIGSSAQGQRDGLQMKRLGELPPAEAYMAVYRTDEKGCLDPMLASERQGVHRPR